MSPFTHSKAYLLCVREVLKPSGISVSRRYNFAGQLANTLCSVISLSSDFLPSLKRELDKFDSHYYEFLISCLHEFSVTGSSLVTTIIMI